MIIPTQRRQLKTWFRHPGKIQQTSTVIGMISVVALLTIFTVTSSFMIIPVAYGHGLEIDTIPPIDIQGKEVSISVEIPTNLIEGKIDQEKITVIVTTTESNTREAIPNVTLLLGMYHDDKLLFKDYFFAEDGTLQLHVAPTEGTAAETTIHGQLVLGLENNEEIWHPLPDTNHIKIYSDHILDKGGLYTFEIEIITLDDPMNIIKDSGGVHQADLSIPETVTHTVTDSNGDPTNFETRTYFDTITRFEYDPATKEVTFEMPFDWSESRMSHVPVVHEEVRFPKEFDEFFTPGYTGYANGIKLFKSSVTIDDYTEEEDRIVHFVLLQDHLRLLKNEIKRSGDSTNTVTATLPDNITFQLSTTQEADFPLDAYTKSEDYLVNLSWEPAEIIPGVETIFIFTIRDGKTGEPMRNSAYGFVIEQEGTEIHRTVGTAQIGGHFEKFVFEEGQTGHTSIKFENIRNTGQETEFGLVVVPEFGVVGTTIIILLVGTLAIIVISRTLVPYRLSVFSHG